MSEAVRLQAVKKFKQLDLQLDSELQDLITMASEICDTPIALITLLDEDTQWIKVKKGTDSVSTPRDSSLCTRAIQQENVFMISDTQVDPGLTDHPATIDFDIRFYAGAPLITRDGLILGTLCVADNKPHVLDKHQMLMLKMLSKQAINIMELRLSYLELEKSKLQAIEHKEAIDNAEIRLRSFFESSVNFHVLLSKNGDVWDYNKTAHNFIKKVHNAKLQRGDLFVNYIAPSFIQTFIEKFNITLTGEKCFAEGSTDYGEHGEIWWEASFEPAWDNNNEVIGVSYSIRNVTDRKQYEQRIVSQNQSLVNIAYIQSHEYRGPLSSIMGMMNLIREEEYKPPVEYLELLENAINKLDSKMQEIVSVVNGHNISHANQAKLF